MTRLDHNRALSQLAEKTGVARERRRKVIIWGNHSATQYPDLHHAMVEGKGGAVAGGPELVQADLHPDRAAARRGHHQGARRLLGGLGRLGGASITSTTGCSARAAGDWVSMGVPSDGSYGIPEGVIYSYPVTCKGGDYRSCRAWPSTNSAASEMTADTSGIAARSATGSKI